MMTPADIKHAARVARELKMDSAADRLYAYAQEAERVVQARNLLLDKVVKDFKTTYTDERVPEALARNIFQHLAENGVRFEGYEFLKEDAK